MRHSLQKTISVLFSYFFFILSLKNRKLFLPRRSKPIRIRKIQFLTRTVLTLFLISFFFFLESFLSCDKTTAPVNKLQLTLTAEYVGVTEADLLLQTKNNEANTQYQLFRDDSLISYGALIQAETIITDTLLLPAHHYSYQAFLIKDEKRIAQSEEQQVTTLDTTSHDFRWESYTIESPFGSATLYDVAIVNENDIWAVGEIYSDSTQPSFRYNAVHWEGAQWRLQRITVRFRDSDITPPGEGIFVFSNSDIWVTLGGAPAHWDGSNWTLYHLWDMGVLTQNDGGVTRIWGSSPDNVYFAGRGGTIVHYIGSSWQKLESPAGASGTDLPIQDIWGAIDPKTGEAFILCPASDKYNVSEKKLLQINTDKHISEIPWPFTDRDPYSTWFNSEKEIYVCGGGVIKRNAKGEYKIISQLPRIFLNKIRGNDINDIFVVGDFGLFAHYNGKSWWIHPDSFYGTFLSVDVKENTIVAVGEQNAREGLVMVVKRN